ncbi:conserved oligomeric Golgi complex subunit 1-like [Uranotaenia lowii]|uniref:conserved oligomeric Golgi complex subunit 1-like n=1 Tax=Uranotaenia lowii TaxID=190385 RepID=UPI002478620A|nr:conserved oligomeric Golgi complex subunit 1-like [Uranotaenia lowii]
MANVTDLLHINVDKLFEQHGVAEIDQVHKRLQAEVELKREELRTMVGERYRDLLKAADTIGDMRNTAGSIIQNIDNITTTCRNLNEHQLIGFRSGTDTHKTQRKNSNSKFHGVIVQIKLLTSLPEIIWSAIDAEDYFVATQLFIFSRHISTGLQLDTNSDMMNKFPVAKKQWAVLSQFFFTIKQNCANCLEREDLSPDVAAKCLASLLLLENCQLDHILSTFVQMRLKAFSRVVQEVSQYEKVKDKILTSLKLLMNTVELIHMCFIGSDALLLEELSLITNESSPPTIAYFKSEDPKIIQILPGIIRNFRPRIQLQPLNSELVRKSSQNWLQTVEKVVTNQFGHLFNLIPSIKMLQDVKKHCLETAERPGSWSENCRNLSLPENLNFYLLYYQPLFNSRAKAIIEHDWSEIIDANRKDVYHLILSIKTDKLLREHKTFVWSESSEDIPRNLKEALDRTHLASHPLLMKYFAFPPALVELSLHLDGKIQSMTNDIISFRETSSPSESEQFEEFFSECSVQNFTELLSSLRSVELKDNLEAVILMARLTASFKTICPALKQCIAPLKQTEKYSPWQDNFAEEKKGNSNTKDRWYRIEGLLDEESSRFWSLWLEDFVKMWPLLEQNVGYPTLLSHFPLWDTITIEENDEQNQIVQSTIRIPALPSFPLQKQLHAIVSLLNHQIPHTLPKPIHVQIIDRLTTSFMEHYQVLASNEFVQKNQNCSLQYYFDLKFLQLLFTGSDQKHFLDRCNHLVATFKGHIDPFDFDVFYFHLNVNVKRAIQRMQQFFGVLLINDDQLSTLSGAASATTTTTTAKPKSQTHDKNPNILALSSNSASETWFPLLPIVTKETLTSLALVNVPESSKPVASVVAEEKVSLTKQSLTKQMQSY